MSEEEKFPLARFLSPSTLNGLLRFSKCFLSISLSLSLFLSLLSFSYEISHIFRRFLILLFIGPIQQSGYVRKRMLRVGWLVGSRLEDF